VESSVRAQAHGPALIGLLARIGGAGVPPPSHSLATRLAQWIDWPQAVALSSALDARPAVATAGAGDDGEYAQVHAALVRAIEGDRAFAPDEAAPDTVAASTPAAATAAVDAAFYRQRYLALQQVMEAESGHRRGRLRGRRAKRGGAPGRIAALDAVMERSLGRHERALLAPIPDLLARHLERVRTEAEATGACGEARPVRNASTAWLDRFRRDMRQLLLAELDFRMRPAQGLHEALAPASLAHHAP